MIFSCDTAKPLLPQAKENLKEERDEPNEAGNKFLNTVGFIC